MQLEHEGNYKNFNNNFKNVVNLFYRLFIGNFKHKLTY